MKRFLMLLGVALLLCGCGKETSVDVLKDFKKNIEGIKSYKLEGTMEISNDEEVFTYSLESSYLKNEYYKVILVNQTNNHEQIILKNKDDVYVITPALNKSFKFQSEWPNNSSQAYLLGSILKDIENDKGAEVTETDSGYVIKSTVSYPNNEELKYQKIYLNKKKTPEKVEVYNTNDLIKIKVNFDNIDLKANLKESNFDLKDYIKEEPQITDSKDNTKPNESNNNVNNNTDSEKKEETNTETKCEEGQTCKTEENNSSATENEKESANIENIIYPLYIPSNTHLKSSEKIDTTKGNRIILTFSGDKNFVLIEEAWVKNNDMEIVPVYGEPLMLSESIGALSANSLSWDVGNISYYLASTDLTISEMQAIANSLGNETLVANTK